MQKKSAPKKGQPKAKKSDPVVDPVVDRLDEIVKILDRIGEMMVQKQEPEDSPDTPDEAA